MEDAIGSVNGRGAAHAGAESRKPAGGNEIFTAAPWIKLGRSAHLDGLDALEAGGLAAELSLRGKSGAWVCRQHARFAAV